jgi:hypothetical protein
MVLPAAQNHTKWRSRDRKEPPWKAYEKPRDFIFCSSALSREETAPARGACSTAERSRFRRAVCVPGFSVCQAG